MSAIPSLLAPSTVLLPSDSCRVDAYTDLGTLAALLARLGHRCRGRCPTEFVPLTGLICVVPGQHLPGSIALVLFDVVQRSEPLSELIDMLRAVNRCTRFDRIRVLLGDGGANPVTLPGMSADFPTLDGWSCFGEHVKELPACVG